VDTKGILLRVGDIVELHVDLEKRKRITRHHSSAHLLQKALKEVVGNHIQQAGSYVDDQKVRFDFTHFEKVTADQLLKVERRVNEMIDAGYDSVITHMDLVTAKKQGAVALFDEKYEDVVRVVRFGDVSTELCGGCHVENTSDIGVFVIEFEESISSGVRRIQASVGLAAYHFVKSKERILQEIATQLGALSVYETTDRLQAQMNHIQEQKTLIEQLKEDIARAYAAQFTQQASAKKEFPLIIKVIKNMDKEVLLKIVDQIKSSQPTYFLYFINQMEDKLQLLAAASQDIVAKGINCGKLIKETATLAGGGGGGRPDMAQAGGKDISKVSMIEQYVQQALENLE
jgi:alanyl-tRNA synthetase